MNNKQFRLSINQIVLRGTIMAVMIAVPSLMSFVVSWIVLDDLFYAVIIGTVIHFIAMGFSLNLSKKLVKK